MFFRKKRNALDEVLDLLQNNLENNYKDEAHKAYKESLQLFEQMKASGILKEKQIANYSQRITAYGQKLDGYGHYNNLEALRFK